MKKFYLRKIVTVITVAGKEWMKDNAPLLSAAIAYYTLFSLAPLLIIAIAIAGTVFGPAAAQNEIYFQIKGLIGKQGALTVQQLILNASKPGSSLPASIFGVLTLIFGASGVFIQIQAALNSIWHVPPKPTHSIKDFVKNNLLSFSMIGGISFLLLVSLLLSAILAILEKYFGTFIPIHTTLLLFINNVISLCVITVLFAFLFKTLPNAKVLWIDVWIGALVSTILFTIGKHLIGLYLGSSAISTAYGSAASLVIVLLWTFYSAQILLYGAEFTKVYARTFNSRIVPDKIE